MHNDETIIRQMCILFSLVRYSDTDKTILTYVSVIPNLKFNFTKAKKVVQYQEKQQSAEAVQCRYAGT